MSGVVRTACTRHCGDGCALLVAERPDGSLSVRGNPEHPFTRGFLCAKTARFGERLASPRRITAPLIREDGEFREASWDETLGLIAAQITRLRKTPERMLHVFYYASFGLLHQASKLLFATLGASAFSGSPCLSAGVEALKRDFGAVRQGPLTDAATADRIVNWGRNVSAQSVHLAAMLSQARKRGARVLSIHPGDPGFGGLSDEQIIIRPGTDRFLAAAAAKLLLQRGLSADARKAQSRCFDPQAFLELLDGWSLDSLLEACGASLEQAHALAAWYAGDMGDAPTATLIGRGLQRYAFGGENVRFIDALAMLSGQIGREGAGVYFKQGDLGNASWGWTQAKPGYARTFPLAALAANVALADPPVEFVWVEGMNLVTQCPDSLATAQMLRSCFTVVVEPFMTDTARCATVILPPALLFECEDVVRNDSHEFVNHSAQVLAPRGQARSNFHIAASLGAMLEPPVVYPDPEEVMDAALRQGKLTATLAELRDKGWLGRPVPSTPWADGVFAHPDGLYRLPDALHPDAPEPDGFPLRLLSFVQKDHLLSQVPEDEQESPPRVFVSSGCPALAGLDLSRPALLETALGSMTVRVDILDTLHPEAVLYPRGDWLSHGGCVNRLIAGRETDMGAQVAYYEQRARLVSAPPSV